MSDNNDLSPTQGSDESQLNMVMEQTGGADQTLLRTLARRPP